MKRLVKKTTSAKKKPSKAASQSLLREGQVSFYAYPAKVVSKGLPVFFNPVMAKNRSISILFLNAQMEENLHACDLLAGTGVRSLRFLKELDKGRIESIVCNDLNPKFPALMKKNLKLNKLSSKIITLQNQDAIKLLIDSTGFDYIDIDPFGTPNPFLDQSIRRLSRRGILAVTATDTSALCGTFKKVCQRKYWAIPRHDYLMHEAGLRILIRKVQLVAAQFEKALEPIYSYSDDHYMRVFFRSVKSKSAVDDILAQHGFWDSAGPMWLGPLWDPKIAGDMANNSQKYPESDSLVQIIAQESKIHSIGFIDIHEIGKQVGIGNLPKTEGVIQAIQSKNHQASRTHFSGSGIRTTMPIKEVIALVKLMTSGK